MFGRFAIIGSAVMLAGCAALLDRAAPAPEAVEETVAAVEEVQPAPRPDSEAEQADPAAAAARPGVLGRTVASLGDPTEDGTWLITGLVTQPARGRVTDLATGAQARVDLRPSGAAPGAGGRLSLAGFQALGLPLTALPDLEVARE